MKIDKKNEARSVGAQKIEIRLSFPLKSHFLDDRNRVLFILNYFPKKNRRCRILDNGLGHLFTPCNVFLFKYFTL